MGLGPPILELKQGQRPPIVGWQNFPPKPLGGADIKGKNLKFGPDFLKTGELWSTYFGIIGRHSRRTTRRPNIVGQSSRTKKLRGVKFWGWFWFSRNWWTLAHIFWRFWKALGKGYKPPEFCGPKFRNKKLLGNQILNFGHDFLKTCELWSRYFGLIAKPSGRNTRHQNIVGQSSETKKLSSDQISKYGPDFLEIGKLWSTYFGTVGNSSRSTTRPPNIVGQS